MSLLLRRRSALTPHGGGDTLLIEPDGATHLHVGDESSLVLGLSVAPEDADHLHVAGEPKLNTKLIEPEESAHLHVVDESTAIQTSVAIPDDAAHLHYSDEPAVTTSVSYQDEVLADTPIHYWRMTETSGTNLEDAVGVLDFTASAGADLTEVTGPAQLGSALGVGPTGHADGSPSLPALPYTIEAVVKMALGERTHVYAESRTNTANAYQLVEVVDDTLDRVARGTLRPGAPFNPVSGTRTLDDNEPHHVVWVFGRSGNSIDIWVDGELDVTGTTDALPTSMVSASIGRLVRNTISYATGGIIDEVAIYDYVLPDARILAHYEATGIVPPAFLPTNRSLIHAWFAADQITGLVDGDPVATWEDSSIRGRDATQATSGFRPIYKTGILNGLPVVRFTPASEHGLQTATFDALPAFTAFVVAKHADGSPGGFQMAFGANAINADSGASVHVLGTSTTNLITFAGTILNGPAPDTDWIRATAIHNGSNGVFDVDGSETSGAIGTRTPIIWTVGHHRQGASGSRGSFWNGDIAEIIVYNRVLTASEIAKVEAYLAGKWGLT